MFKLEVDEDSIQRLVKKLTTTLDDNLPDYLGAIRWDWREEVVQQQDRLQSSWRRLTDKYRNSKVKRESAHPLEKLKLNGNMMRQYAAGGLINDDEGEVTFPFPEGTPAVFHQNESHDNPRDFEIEPFHDLAVKRFTELIVKVIR